MEKPILFSTSMVSAVLAGNKNQTRRTTGLKKINEDPDRYLFHKIVDGVAVFYDGRKGERVSVKLPYGLPGNILWVREVHYRYGYWRANGISKKTGRLKFKFHAGRDITMFPEITPFNLLPNTDHGPGWYKRNSLFMPRSCARTFLEVEKVRVERLHDISGHDVLAEGVDNEKSNPSMGIRWENMQKMAFQELWESINGPGSWAANPWLWVVEFKVIPCDTIKK